MLPYSALSQMHPLVVTPSHDGKYFHNYVLSLLSLQQQAAELGLPLQVLLHRGESLITRARNNCVAAFMANPTWTHLFWIDSDIGFSPEAALRLLLSDHDIAAGVYPLKYENWPAEGLPQGMTQAQFTAAYARYTVNIERADADNAVHLHIDEHGFIAMDDAPTGFMVIKRQVFERLMTAHPELQYNPDSIGVENQGLHYRLFDCMVDPTSRRYLSEDYGFCRLWQGLGGKIHIDTRSNLTHQGSKLYHGPFAQSLLDNLPHAVGAPAGASMHLHNAAPLQLNPAP